MVTMKFARMKGCGWGWCGVVWLYSLVTYIPLDILKFIIRYTLSGKAWNNMIENRVCSTLIKLVLFSKSLLIDDIHCFLFVRPRSPQRKTMVGESERLSGRLLNVLSMALNLRIPCLMTRRLIPNFRRLLNKRKSVQKSLGN